MSLSLSGSVLGQALNVGLNPLQTSSGTTSIVTSGNQFLVNSFFNVYLSASLGSSPAFDLSRFQLTLVARPVSSTPLPDALPLFATGLAALALFGWRRKRRSVLR
jgi:MYXO-CTERM domain-containing protein